MNALRYKIYNYQCAEIKFLPWPPLTPTSTLSSTRNSHREGSPSVPPSLPENYPINTTHTIQLSNMNMSAIRELSLEKCKINHESIEELSRIHFPILTKLNLSKKWVMQATMRLGRSDAARCRVRNY